MEVESASLCARLFGTDRKQAPPKTRCPGDGRGSRRSGRLQLALDRHYLTIAIDCCAVSDLQLLAVVLIFDQLQNALPCCVESAQLLNLDDLSIVQVLNVSAPFDTPPKSDQIVTMNQWPLVSESTNRYEASEHDRLRFSEREPSITPDGLWNASSATQMSLNACRKVRACEPAITRLMDHQATSSHDKLKEAGLMPPLQQSERSTCRSRC